MVDGFIAFLPMGVVKTGHAVIKIISGGDDESALKLLCNASHPVSHSQLTGGSLASPITEDQEIQHDKRVSFVTTPFSRHLSNDNFINDRLSPGGSSEAQVCLRFDPWFLTGGTDSSAQRSRALIFSLVQLLKFAGQSVKLFYDFIVVGLNVLACELVHFLFYFFAGHGRKHLALIFSDNISAEC